MACNHPRGLFCSIAQAAKAISIVRGVDVTTVDQVRQSLFNPDLVRESLAGDPDGEMRRAGEHINLDKVLDSGPAPFVEITSHSPGSKSNTALITVSARVRDRGKGIGRIEWRVNDITINAMNASAGAGATYEVKHELALDPGENEIDVVEQKHDRKALEGNGATVPPSLVVATMYEASSGSFLDRVRTYFKSPLKIKKHKSLAEHELFSSADGVTVKEKYGSAERELKEVSLAVLSRIGLAATTSNISRPARAKE